MGLYRFARENRADRMRNRVVNVKQIQVFRLRDRRHFRRERQRIRLMLEQRIRHHLDFVKTHSLVKFGQTSRQSGSDEMDGMAARGKLSFPARSRRFRCRRRLDKP